MTSKFAGLEIGVDKPRRMILVHPVTRQPIRDAEGTEAWIDVHSSDSPVARSHTKEMQRRRLNMGQRAPKMTPEELEANAVDLLAALTAGWNLLSMDGAALDVPFSEANARELYSAPTLQWVRDQVDDFAADRANFT